MDLLETRALLTTVPTNEVFLSGGAPADVTAAGDDANHVDLVFEPHFLKSVLANPTRSATLKGYLAAPTGSLTLPINMNATAKVSDFGSAELWVKVDGEYYNITKTVGWVDNVIIANSAVTNGTAANDLIIGLNNPAVPDAINGGAGNDLILARAGDDVVEGGLGADVIYGGQGNDVINGDSGSDILYGGAGNDTLNGGSNADQVFGEAGDDTITFDWFDFQRGEVVDGGTGFNRLNLFFRNTYGSALQDTFTAANAAQVKVINDFVADPKNPSKQLDGELGYIRTSNFQSAGIMTSVDWVQYDPALPTGWIDITAAIGRLDTALVGVTNTASLDKATAKLDGNNVIIGTTGADALQGFGGNDLIFGRAGDDVIGGGAGDDTLYGGAGDDTLSTGSGRDKAYGEAGKDTINFYYAMYNSGLELDGGGQAGDTLNIQFKAGLFDQLSPGVQSSLESYELNPTIDFSLGRNEDSKFVFLNAKRFKQVNLQKS